VDWEQPPRKLDPLSSQMATISECRSVLTDAMKLQIPPLQQYLSTLAPFLPLLNTQPPAVLAAWQRAVATRKRFPRDAIFNSIRSHMHDRKELLATLPTAIHMGMFEVSMVAVRDKLATVHDRIAKGLMDIVDQWCSAATATVAAKTTAIRHQIRGRMKTVEQAVGVEQLFEEAPVVIGQLEDQLKEVFETSDLLSTTFE
jgi:hypothetical protein